MEVEIIRAFERILIVLFSGVSIILGWHLFKIGVVSPQSGSFSGKGFKFSLQKVGPGIFFSLFGATVLSVALVYGLEKTVTQNGNNEVASTKLANMLQETDVERLVRATNTILLIDVEKVSPYGTTKKAIKHSIEVLTEFRDRNARLVFGKDKMQSYQDCRLDNNDSGCKTAKNYMEIDKWLSTSYVQNISQ